MFGVYLLYLGALAATALLVALAFGRMRRTAVRSSSGGVIAVAPAVSPTTGAGGDMTDAVAAGDGGSPSGRADRAGRRRNRRQPTPPAPESAGRAADRDPPGSGGPEPEVAPGRPVGEPVDVSATSDLADPSTPAGAGVHAASTADLQTGPTGVGRGRAGMRPVGGMRRVGALVGIMIAVVAGTGVGLAAPASAATNPRTVKVQVVPELAGVNFTLGGTPGVTGPGGSAVVPDTNLAGAAAQLGVPNQNVLPTVRVRLDRVATDPNHGVFTRTLLAELDEDRLVQIQPLTPKGLALPTSKVTSVTLTDTLGRTLTYSGKQLASPIWLESSVPAQVGGGVGGRLVTYSVKSVIIRGSNVVNSGQSRFTPGSTSNAKQPVFAIPVILYNLTIEANDLLAGAPSGKTALLTYPDHSVAAVALGPTHRVVLKDLPRGTYQLKVKGSLVPLGSTIRLSRSQTATQLLVTPGDAAEIAFLVLVLLAIVVGAGVYGRRLRRQKEEAGGAAGHGGDGHPSEDTDHAISV